MKPRGKASQSAGTRNTPLAARRDSPCSDLKTILPIRDAMEILYGKWKLPILGTLFTGPKRFRALQREIKGITPKMLSKELKDLEMNDLVSRTVYDSAPVSVEYAMTRYGSSLENVVRELHAWGTAHRKRIIGKGRAQRTATPLPSTEHEE